MDAKANRILLFSHRNLADKIFVRCMNYEFEEVICQIDSARVLAPMPNRWFKYGTRIAQKLAENSWISLNPGIDEIRVRETYDLFFTFCEFAKDLLCVNAVKGW